MRLGNITTNRDAADNGRWFTFAHDFRLRLRSQYSPAYESVRIQVRAPYKASLDQPRPDPELAEKVSQECVARGLVTDWNGIEDDQAIPFTAERCMELFQQIDGLYLWVLQMSGTAENYIGPSVSEADAGN